MAAGWLPPRDAHGDGSSGSWRIQDVLGDYQELKRWRDVVHFWLLIDGTVEALREVSFEYESEEDKSEARLVRAEIAMAAILDGFDADDELRMATLRSFVEAVARCCAPEDPFPKETTLRRLARDEECRTRFIGFLEEVRKDLPDDAVDRDAIEALRQFMTDVQPAPSPNAFRKFGVYESDDLKLPRRFDRFGRHEARPSRNGLAHGTWTRARPSGRNQTAAHERAATTDDADLLLSGEDVVERPEHQPHAPDDIQQLAETHAQGRNLPGGGAGAFAGDHGTGQHNRGDLLRAGFHRVTLQDRGPTQTGV